MIGFIVYLFFYTLLKYKTSTATLVGSIAGAMPPVVGYVAKSSYFDIPCLLLFLIVVFWQMPHFYAIALYRINDYKAANIPVLPIAKGIESTKKEMFIYTIAYTISCFLLAFLGYVGSFYMVAALVLGFSWIVLCIKGFKEKNVDIWARQMFKFSLVVVMILSFIISVDVSS
jgi:protoheme IX farnesyltransferase